ncbi:unnamed protein product, partial [Prunus armeniaca]
AVNIRIRREKNIIRVSWRTTSVKDHFIPQWTFAGKQKLTAVFRMLAYGCSADTINEYLRLGESIALKCLRKFCSVIEAVCGQWYLRLQNPADLYRLLHMASHRLFPSMLGSLDCMHWEWENCPTAWACQFTGYKHKPAVILEPVASYDTWMWHAFLESSDRTMISTS